MNLRQQIRTLATSTGAAQCATACLLADTLHPRRAVRAIGTAQVADFASLLLEEAIPTLLQTLVAIEASGISRESIMLGLLGPAARQLGALWQDDQINFFEATLGCNVLQALLRWLAPDFEGNAATGGRKAILLAPVTGDQHTLGLSMLAAFFRRAGWSVVFEPGASEDLLAARLSAGQFDAVGLSAGSTRSAAVLPDLVSHLRQCPATQSLVILVGGAAFLADAPELEALGVDGVAQDPSEAVRLAEKLTEGRQTATARMMFRERHRAIAPLSSGCDRRPSARVEGNSEPHSRKSASTQPARVAASRWGRRMTEE